MSSIMKENEATVTNDKKLQILNAARNVFSRKGFAEATTAEIAREAGVAEGTIYNHFKNKRDLLMSLVGSFAILDESLLNIFKQPPGHATGSLESLLENRISIGFENYALLPLLLAELQRSPEFGKQYSKGVLNPGLGLVKAYLDMRISNGTLRPVNTEVAARLLVGMIIGLIAIYQIEGEDGFFRKYPLQELADEVARMMSEGLGNGQYKL